MLGHFYAGLVGVGRGRAEKDGPPAGQFRYLSGIELHLVYNVSMSLVGMTPYFEEPFIEQVRCSRPWFSISKSGSLARSLKISLFFSIQSPETNSVACIFPAADTL